MVKSESWIETEMHQKGRMERIREAKKKGGDLKVVSKKMLLMCCAIGIGAILGFAAVTGFETMFNENTTISCLTSLDLNRDDLAANAFLSHECEAMGYVTVPYWQSDEQGNRYFIPVCVETT